MNYAVYKLCLNKGFKTKKRTEIFIPQKIPQWLHRYHKNYEQTRNLDMRILPFIPTSASSQIIWFEDSLLS